MIMCVTLILAYIAFLAGINKTDNKVNKPFIDSMTNI